MKIAIKREQRQTCLVLPSVSNLRDTGAKIAIKREQRQTCLVLPSMSNLRDTGAKIAIKREQRQTCLVLPSVSNLRDAGAKIAIKREQSPNLFEVLPSMSNLGKTKIGIITILKVNNYGAELQAYALPKALNDLGYDAENIDYLYYKHPDYVALPLSKPMVKISLKNRVKRKILILMENISSVLSRGLTKARNAKFEEFHRKHTSLSEKTYRSIEELYTGKFDYDLFMVGSDQVWNPSTLTSLKPYFLTFVPEGKRKISYASSFGVHDIKEEYQAIYTECLNNLDYISTREKRGVEIVRQLTGREATHVVDPTLLVSKEDWEKIGIIPQEKEPYILLYILTRSPYIARLAKKLKEITGHQVIRICNDPVFTDRDPQVKNIFNAGPSEFVGWFRNASLILTNSFHGTCFSVIFQKQFFTIIPKGKSNNSRQQNFLELLKLESRLLKEGDPFPEKDRLKIDYAKANQILAGERERSVHFLQSTINNKL